MNQNYCIQILSTDDYVPPFECSGKQLVEILNIIASIFDDLEWVVGDIVGTSEKLGEKWTIIEESKLLESTYSLIELSEKVYQFESGVFVGRHKELDNSKILPKDMKRLFMDDPEPYLNNSIIDIRAFDTTFYIVFSSNERIIAALKKNFKYIVGSPFK